MLPDSHGRATVRNLYYDTDSFLLIRRSVEKPLYKEKLRLRSYSTAEPHSPVFVEIKKKFKGTVYKRRLTLPERESVLWLAGESPCPVSSQISNEISYFLKLYGNLSPRVFLSYDREAYFDRDDPGFRVTFDSNILCRNSELSLCAEPSGAPVLDEGLWLMELKCAGAMPLWMSGLLSREQIFKTSFSKYGRAYAAYFDPFPSALFHS